MKKGISFLLFNCVIIICIAFVVGLTCLKKSVFGPKTYTDLEPVHQIGLFQNLEIESGSCTFEVPPSVRTPIQPLLRSVLNWYGECALSDETTEALLMNYSWEDWNVSEGEWENAKNNHQTIYYSHFFMFEFDNLKEQYVNNSFLVCHDFDVAQDNSHRIGQLYSYLDINTRTLFFYYSSS